MYFPCRNFRTLVLPFWVGYLIGWVVSHMSNMLNLNRPFAEPSLYALYSVSRNLDFGNRKIMELFRKRNYRPVTREEGVAELMSPHKNMK